MMKKIIFTVLTAGCFIAANAQVENKTPDKKNTASTSTTNVQQSNTAPENKTQTDPASSTNGSTNITVPNTQTQPTVKKKLLKVSSKKLNAVSSAPVEKKSSGTETKSDDDDSDKNPN